MTADAAVLGIREVDPPGTIALIGAESHPPYDRPPLSKKLWPASRRTRSGAPPRTPELELRIGRRAVAIDPLKKIVADSHGVQYAYRKLLLATGGTPRSAAQSGLTLLDAPPAPLADKWKIR